MSERPIRRPWTRRLAMWVLLAFVGLAVAGKFLAWDRPLYLDLAGEVYLLPNIIDYQALRGLEGDRLRARMTRADLAVWPPVAHHPNAVRSRGTVAPLEPPSVQHWLGTDDRGRDVLARLVHGARSTCVTALGATLAALVLSLALAILAVRAGLAGHAGRPGEGRLARIGGGVIDSAILGLCDLGAAIPAVIFVVAAQGLTGRGGAAVMIALIAVPRAADTARIARSAMRSALAAPYCQAARAIGARPMRIIVRHALPHAAPHLAVASAITAATAVLAEAALGFLGFGTPPPDPSWGELLRQAHENGLPWHLTVPAGVAIAAVAAALGALAQPDAQGAARST